MLRSRTIASSSSSGLTSTPPSVVPTFPGSASKAAAIVMPCSAKIGDEATRADERDVVLPLCPQDLADLREQRIDRIPDTALAELAETGEVTADLRRVDVRVFGDLLRRDPLLPHLARLRQHLEVPTQARCDPDPQTFRHDHLRTSL